MCRNCMLQLYVTPLYVTFVCYTIVCYTIVKKRNWKTVNIPLISLFSFGWGEGGRASFETRLGHGIYFLIFHDIFQPYQINRRILLPLGRYSSLPCPCSPQMTWHPTLEAIHFKALIILKREKNWKKTFCCMELISLCLVIAVQQWAEITENVSLIRQTLFIWRNLSHL
jgi:hypothetical protein